MLRVLDELCVPLLQGCFVRRRPDSRVGVLILCLLDEVCAALLQGFLCKKTTRFYGGGSVVLFT